MLADILQTCVFVFAWFLWSTGDGRNPCTSWCRKHPSVHRVSMSFFACQLVEDLFHQQSYLEGCRMGCSLARPFSELPHRKPLGTIASNHLEIGNPIRSYWMMGGITGSRSHWTTSWTLMKLSQRAEDNGRGIKNRQWLLSNTTWTGWVGECLHSVDISIKNLASSWGFLDDFPDVLTNGGHFLSHVPCVSFCEATPKLKDIESKCCWGESCCCTHVNLLTHHGTGMFLRHMASNMTWLDLNYISDLYSFNQSIKSINQSIHPCLPKSKISKKKL